jgi:hypothetical protein
VKPDGRGAWRQSSTSRKGEGNYDPEAPGKPDEKSHSGTKCVPVLKLTQVGGMKILRRSRERWRRNSAT